MTTRKANERDIEFIENRLLAPAVECGDAIERLRRTGYGEIAEALTGALQEFTDHCRTARHLLSEARRQEAILR